MLVCEVWVEGIGFDEAMLEPEAMLVLSRVGYINGSDKWGLSKAVRCLGGIIYIFSSISQFMN